MKKSKSYCIVNSLIIILLLLNSCTAYKEIPYLKNSETSVQEKLNYPLEVNEPRIMPNDIISITVNSTLVGAVSDFNLPLIPNNLNKSDQTSIASATGSSGSLQNYVVDKNGEIDFPVLGEIAIGGLTLDEAKNKISSLIYPRYISEKPIVNIRFVNFKVSVLGEVARPGVYSTENGQMTIFDALAAAGDMTIYGKRDNVLLIRLKSDGDVEMHRINLQNIDLASNKEVFYLQQNDKLYIEPNKAKGNNSRFGTFEAITLSTISIIISVVAILSR